MEIHTLSASRVIKYLHCPWGYRYAYVEKLYKLPTSSLTRGIIFHDILKVNYRQKVETHQDLPVNQLKERFAADFDLFETDFRDDDPGMILDSGIRALEEYQRVIAPTVQPVEVEESFVMEFKKVKWNFQGKVDLVDDLPQMRETKTTSKGVNKVKPDHWIQATSYIMAIRRKLGLKTMKARVDYAVCLKTTQRVESFEIEITESDERSFLFLLAEVAKGVEAEVFPHHRIDNFCSRRYCSYWRECEEDRGGRVRD